MGEAVDVNLFLTVRVLILGWFFLVLPRITRKGLLFGMYIGEAACGEEAAQRIADDWNRLCHILIAVALIVAYSISLAGSPKIGNLTGTSVLLLGAFMA